MASFLWEMMISDFKRNAEKCQLLLMVKGYRNFSKWNKVQPVGLRLRHSADGGMTVRPLQRAFEAGINHFDVDSYSYYKGRERNLAPFRKKHRDQVWLVSKAPTFVHAKCSDSIMLEQAKSAVKYWIGLMDASLKNLQADYVDAYYLMAVDNLSHRELNPSKFKMLFIVDFVI